MMQPHLFESKINYKHPEKQHILNAFINILNSKKQNKGMGSQPEVSKKEDQQAVQRKGLQSEQTADHQENQKDDDCVEIIQTNIKTVPKKVYRNEKIQIQLPLFLISSKHSKRHNFQKSKPSKNLSKQKQTKNLKNTYSTSILQYEQDPSRQSDQYDEQLQQLAKSRFTKKQSKKAKKVQKANKKMNYKQSYVHDDQQIEIGVQCAQLKVVPTKLMKASRQQIYIEENEESQEVPVMFTKGKKQFIEQNIEIVVEQNNTLKMDIIMKKVKKQRKKTRVEEIILLEEEQEKVVDKNVGAKFKECQVVVQVIEDLQIITQIKSKISNKKLLKTSEKKEINKIDTSQQQQETVQVVRDYTKPYRLGNVPLKELVKQLSLKKIIKQQIYTDFLKVHSYLDVQDFLSKFQQGKLHHFNYKQIKFTLLDHRRITQLLQSLYPTQYFLGQIYAIDPQSNKFLHSVYEMQAQAYYNLFNKIDKISRVKWWSKILITYEDKLTINHKEKMIAKRKAEQASLAVEQAIKSILNKSNDTDKKKKNFYSIDLDDDGQEMEKKNVEDNSKDIEKKKQKERLQAKQKEQLQLNKIRSVVANFGKNPVQTATSDTMTKKIKFY